MGKININQMLDIAKYITIVEGKISIDHIAENTGFRRDLLRAVQVAAKQYLRDGTRPPHTIGMPSDNFEALRSRLARLVLQHNPQPGMIIRGGSGTPVICNA